MQRRTNICRCVHCINETDDTYQEIVSLETIRSEIQISWIYQINYHRYSKCQNEEFHEISEVVSLIDQCIYKSDSYQRMPCQIWYHENFVERYHIVQKAVHFMESLSCIYKFNADKTSYIYRPKQYIFEIIFKFDYSVIQLPSFRKAIAQLISPFAVLA